MEQVYKLGDVYRDTGSGYREAEDDEFRVWLTEPIPDDRSTFPMTTGMKALSSYADNGIGEYAVFILISKEDDKSYPDEIDIESGEIRYWGDAKRDTPSEDIDIDSFYGNKRLAPEYEKIKNGQHQLVAPILFFNRERTGFLRFVGLCVLETVTYDKYPQQFDGREVWTSNYLYHLSILDEPEVPVSWIHERTLKGTDSQAPDSWKQWKETGEVSDEIRYQPSSQERGETQPTPQGDDREQDTSGSTVEYEVETVTVSNSFRERAFDLYDHTCILTDIRESPLVTLSHVVPRSEAIEYAEDISNVVLLNWTHHMAFDSGLFTFDKDLHLWVHPQFEPSDSWLQATLHDRHGTQIELPEGAELSPQRIEERNDSLEW